MQLARDVGPFDIYQSLRIAAARFELPVFAGRVAWRDETSEEEALRRAVAVLEVLDAAVAPELMIKLEDVLPPGIRDVLPSGRARG